MTIHGSKSELKRPRYHENQDGALIAALQTSGSHNFWFDRWIFEFHTFLETENQYLSKGVKISPIRGGLALKYLPPLFFVPRAINSPMHAPDREDTHFSEISLLPSLSIHFFSLPNTNKHLQHSKNTHKSFLILASPPRTQGIIFDPSLPFLSSTSWIWGLGVWM